LQSGERASGEILLFVTGLEALPFYAQPTEGGGCLKLERRVLAC
jgi:hypothetical protein